MSYENVSELSPIVTVNETSLATFYCIEGSVISSFGYFTPVTAERQVTCNGVVVSKKPIYYDVVSAFGESGRVYLEKYTRISIYNNGELVKHQVNVFISRKLARIVLNLIK